MDPEAALDRAEEAIKNYDKREAKDALRDYANWRARGGFQPPGGDARAQRIDRAILNFGNDYDRHVSPMRTTNPSGPKFRGLGTSLPTTYDHLMADFSLRPRQIAQHLRDVHHVEPKLARKGYEKDVWRYQHESLHRGGISGFQYNLLSDHTSDGEKQQGLGDDVQASGDRSRMSHWGGDHVPGKTGKFTVRSVPLDRGGYANKGRDYFGGGPPLYLVQSYDGDVEFYIRAGSRSFAIDEVHRMYPQAQVRA